MEVEFNPGLNVNPGTGQAITRQPNIQPADTTMSFQRTQALQKILQETPQVRPEAVTQASALIADENYPSDTVLSKMAGFLAGKMSSAGDDQS
jgi:hypothetical protein